MKFKRMTKIVCTIGPKTFSYEMLEKLALAGMNVARLNFSHGNYEQHKTTISRIKKLNDTLEHPIAILLDTQGPEIRTGILKTEIKIKKGTRFIFSTNDVFSGETQGTTLSYKHTHEILKTGNTILVDDGMLEFEVQSIDKTEIYCIALNSGVLKSRKGVNLPGISVDMPTISEEDLNDIDFGIENDIDFIALSFVKNAKDVIKIRNRIKSKNAETLLISKIEHIDAINNFNEILEASDGIMVARGDLGINMPFEEIPAIQKKLIKKCNEAEKPVITATHMLNSMIDNPRPTRAEVSDVANSMLNGTDAVMLSAESASGNYPLESVEVLDKICRATEKDLKSKIYTHYPNSKKIASMLGKAVVLSAEAINAKAIIALTETGQSVFNLSKYKSKIPIFAMATSIKTRRLTSLCWGVYSFSLIEHTLCECMKKESISILKNKNILSNNDFVVISSRLNSDKYNCENIAEIRKIENNLTSDKKKCNL